MLQSKKDIQEAITLRFIEAYENILAMEIVKDQSEFAKKLGVPKQNMSNILNRSGKPRRYPTLEMIYKLGTLPKMDINAHWIITGEGPIFKPTKGRGVIDLTEHTKRN